MEETKIRSTFGFRLFGYPLKNGTNQVSFSISGGASKSGRLSKNENPKFCKYESGGLLMNENQSFVLGTLEKEEPRFISFRQRLSSSEELRFISPVGFQKMKTKVLSNGLPKNKTQSFVSSASGFSELLANGELRFVQVWVAFEFRRMEETKIVSLAFGWASEV
ncbi:hypothetical protein C1646_768163 [Rhizophagus diaphanus]|nr:hypothetical protein C1646_768163 [Rhizophagus diaphanus] [Rhizophagus sp. MUCL 43196]